MLIGIHNNMTKRFTFNAFNETESSIFNKNMAGFFLPEQRTVIVRCSRSLTAIDKEEV
jgi:hypothetical protein